MLILHLSDIHFRKGDVDMTMDPNRHLRNELLIDAREMCRRIGTPSAIVISGDISYSADSEEFNFAYRWLEELCTNCGARLSDVFLIPGNHDVARSIASHRVVQALHRDIKGASSDVALDGIMRECLKDDEAGRMLYESLGPYNAFAGQFFCDLLPPSRTMAIRDLPLNDGSMLRLCGLNSTFVSSNADKKGDLFVDPASFQLMREPGIELLVTCHHPYEWLRQGASLRSHLNDVARLQLFGHDHTNRIDLNRDYVQIAASAAHPDRSEAGWEPGYNFISVGVEAKDGERWLCVDAHVRVWQQTPGQFRPKMDRGGADTFRQRIKLDPWQPPHQGPEQSAAEKAAMATKTDPSMAEPTGRDPMDTLRELSMTFFRLSLSQKSAIAGRLELLEEEDANQPDFERFRRVLIRARDRGKIDDLRREIASMNNTK